jgi:hypothetical protein
VKANSWQALALLVLVFSLTVASVQMPDRVFSERENRYLKQAPAFRWEAILSGRFSARFEEYESDQFPWRDAWVFLKTGAERLLGKRDNHGVYFGEGGWLLGRFSADLDMLERNLHHIDGFASLTGIPTSLMLAPTSTAVYPEKLPPFAPTDDQGAVARRAREVMSRVRVVDPVGAFTNAKDEYIYFRTDHHWTMLGAYYAYAEWMRLKGEQPLPLDRFTQETVSSVFFGTYYSRANLREVRPDTIEVLSPIQALPISVAYPDQGLVRTGWFWPDNLDGNDKYTYFLGGNHPEVEITTAEKNGKRLLIVKDSYANCFIPLLAPHYEFIDVVDLRYYAGNAAKLAKEKAINEVLFLYSTQQLNQESGLERLGPSEL